jgi:hypothetical protein
MANRKNIRGRNKFKNNAIMLAPRNLINAHQNSLIKRCT